MVQTNQDADLRKFGGIVAKLEHLGPDQPTRRVVLHDIMKLVDADFVISYIWNARTSKFSDPFAINIDENHMNRYETDFQFYDPISSKLRTARKATPIDKIIADAEFRNSKFYNDFLKPDGLYHGINIYIFNGDTDLGDFRIWRAKDRPAFGPWEIALLDALEPHLRRSIIRTDFTFPELTLRERDVVVLVARGLTDRDIARMLDISFSTVRTHLNRILEKLGCASRVELAGLIAGFRR